MRCTLIWFLSDLRWYGMASLRYEHGDVCSYDIERLLLPVLIMMVLVIYGMDTGVSVSLSFKWILLPVHIDVNIALCASCVGMASLWYVQGRGDECFYNVAWMVFPVNCDAMGFLRYGQRDISLYNFGVNTIFCTLCDDIAYRQRDVCFYNIDMNTASATHCADMGHLVYGQGETSVSMMLTWRLLQVHVVWACLLCGMEHVKVTIWLFPGDPLNFNGSPGNNHGNLGWHVCMGPPRSAPTARSDRLLKQSAPGIRAVCFKSSSQQPVTAVRPRPAPTARSDELLQQSAPGICAVCFKSPPRRSVTAVRPRPDPTTRSGGPMQQSAWGIREFVWKVHPSGPSRTSVTARSHELLKQTAPHTTETNQTPFRRRHFQMHFLEWK